MLISAFEQVFPDAIKADGAYLVLMERVPFYGGPEEGGWWGEDRIVHSYKQFVSTELAEKTKGIVHRRVLQMNADARRCFGEQCLRESEWLEERNLDDSFLREPDGESEFYLLVTEEIPENEYGNRHYE